MLRKERKSLRGITAELGVLSPRRTATSSAVEAPTKLETATVEGLLASSSSASDVRHAGVWPTASGRSRRVITAVLPIP